MTAIQYFLPSLFLTIPIEMFGVLVSCVYRSIFLSTIFSFLDVLNARICLLWIHVCFNNIKKSRDAPEEESKYSCSPLKCCVCIVFISMTTWNHTHTHTNVCRLKWCFVVWRWLHIYSNVFAAFYHSTYLTKFLPDIRTTISRSLLPFRCWHFQYLYCVQYSPVIVMIKIDCIFF